MKTSCLYLKFQLSFQPSGSSLGEKEIYKGLERTPDTIVKGFDPFTIQKEIKMIRKVPINI
jgi:hypothetical protein